MVSVLNGMECSRPEMYNVFVSDLWKRVSGVTILSYLIRMRINQWISDVYESNNWAAKWQK